MSAAETTQNDAREITYDELKQHVAKENLYVLLHNKVYDVSKFIDEHPGGDEVMLAEAGKDATEAFEDVGHSDEARDIVKTLFVGNFEKDGILKTKETSTRVTSGTHLEHKSSSTISFIVPLALLGAYFAWRYYSS